MQIDKIDPLYYKQSSRIDVAEDTKINANKQESDEYYAEDSAASSQSLPLHRHVARTDLCLPASAPNFISEIFFLCAQYLHIGPMHAIKEHKGISQQVSHMQRQLNDMEADSTWRGVRLGR